MHSELERIYRAHRRGLFAVALTITKRSGDAEDAIHDAFSRLCKAALNEKPAEGRDAVAYVFAAVRNAAVDRVRQRKSAGNIALELAPSMAVVSAFEANGERESAVAAAIDTLPDDLQMVLFFRIFAGLTFRQIGELVGEPLPTVASRYKTALAKLKPQLKDWL